MRLTKSYEFMQVPNQRKVYGYIQPRRECLLRKTSTNNFDLMGIGNLKRKREQIESIRAKKLL